MTTFAADKFNAETDPDRPVLGSEIDYKDEKYTIEKVEAKEAGEVTRMIMNDEEPDKLGYEDVLIKPHAERPFVMWFVYVNKKKEAAFGGLNAIIGQ
jgi:hypothetical protein